MSDSHKPIEEVLADVTGDAITKLRLQSISTGEPHNIYKLPEHNGDLQNSIVNSRLRDPTSSIVSMGEESLLKKDTRTSNTKTMMHLLKGNIGTGILAMPYAVMKAGLAIGSVGIPIIGLISIHCMHMLVDCSKQLCRKHGVESLDYSLTAEYCFKEGPAFLRKLSTPARIIVNVMLLLTQFGFCCVYILFVATTLSTVIGELTGSCMISIQGYIAIILPLMMLYNQIKNLNHLAYFSTGANVMQISGLIIIYAFLFKDIASVRIPPLTNVARNLPIFFGTAMYAFEGIGVVLPLENEMKTPADFGGFTGVLNTGMVIVTCLYTGMGFFGYLKFGDSVADSITLNLPHYPFYQVIKLVFGLSLFLSYALQAYVPFKILWPMIEKTNFIKSHPTYKPWIDFGFRTFIVTITACLAMIIPHLDLFISLVGSLASSSLALIFPPILQLSLYHNSKLTKCERTTMWVKNSFIITFGLIGFGTGTYTTITEIVNQWSDTPKSCIEFLSS